MTEPGDPRLDLLDGDTERLVELIGDALVGETGQYRQDVVAGEDVRVELVRACGRKAGRRRRIQVRTFAHELPEGGREVWVLNVAPIDPSDDLTQRRWRQRVRAAAEAGSLGPPHTR